MLFSPGSFLSFHAEIDGLKRELRDAFLLRDRRPWSMIEIFDALFSKGTFLSAIFIVALIALIAGLYHARW